MDVESLDAANDSKDSTSNLASSHNPAAKPSRVELRKASVPYKIVEDTIENTNNQQQVLYRMPAHTPEITLVNPSGQPENEDMDEGEEEEEVLFTNNGFTEEEEDFYNPRRRPTLEHDGYRYRARSDRAQVPVERATTTLKPHPRVSAHPRSVPSNLFYKTTSGPPSRSQASHPNALRAVYGRQPIKRTLPRRDICSQQTSHPPGPVRTRVREGQEMASRLWGVIQDPARPRPREALPGGQSSRTPNIETDVSHSGFYNAVAGPSRLGNEMMDWVPKAERCDVSKKQRRY